MNNNTHCKTTSRKNKKLHTNHGGATLLLTILLSVAITILCAYMFFNTRGMQTVLNASPAQFYAKSVSWSGVSVFREYLHSLSQTEFDQFRTNTEFEITIEELDVTLRVSDIVIEDVSSITADYKINARIQDISDNAVAGKPLEISLLLDAPPPPPVVAGPGPGLTPGSIEPNTLYFGGDIDITGDQTIQIFGATPGQIVTAGDVSFTNSTFTGLENVYAGGDVWLESANTAQYIHADGNVTITEGAVVEQIRALGDVQLRISGHAKEIRANGTVTLDGGTDPDPTNYTLTEFVSAQGPVFAGDPGRSASAPRGNHGYLESQTDVLVRANIREVDLIYSQGNVVVGANELDRVGEVSAAGNLNCSTTTPRFVLSYANIAGTKTGCPNAPAGVAATGPVVGASTVPVPARSELALGVTPTGINIPVFDVVPLKPQANYIVRITQTSGTNVSVQVTVQNVNGIADGDYTLAKISPAPISDFADALCKNVSGEDCLDNGSVNPIPVFCYGPNWQRGTTSRIRSCFEWDPAKNMAVLRGRYMLPGIVYFENDLIIQRSDHTGSTPNHSAENSFRNTILVEGDVIVSNNGSVTSVNHAGYNEICQFSFWDNNVPRQNYFPTNLCNTATNSLIYTNTGNIAIGNGKFDPGGSYSGGDILLESQGTIFGSIIAGDRFQCTGNRIVTGMVSGLALTQGNDRHNISGECRFGADLTSGSLNPIDLPFTQVPGNTGSTPADPSGSNGTGTPTPVAPSTMQNARVLWSRYN